MPSSRHSVVHTSVSSSHRESVVHVAMSSCSHDGTERGTQTDSVGHGRQPPMPSSRHSRVQARVTSSQRGSLLHACTLRPKQCEGTGGSSRSTHSDGALHGRQPPMPSSMHTAGHAPGSSSQRGWLAHS